MKTLPITLLCSVLSATAAVAQVRPGGQPTGPAHTVTTSSDFGVLATLGAASDHDAVASGTGVRRTLEVQAQIGGRQRGVLADATTTVQRTLRGVSVTESGTLRNDSVRGGGAVGTSDDGPLVRQPGQGAHSVRATFPIAAGTNAIVMVQWRGRASAGAGSGASVDINGDGIADFSASTRAGGGRDSAALQVVAGRAGVIVDITTNGQASLTGLGSEGYRAGIQVSVVEGSLPTSCVFTNFGTACGADLNGSVGRTLDLQLDVSNATADAMGVLLIGDQLARPQPLPIGTCDLLVDSRPMGGNGVGFRTDPNGAATIALRTPRAALSTSFQALVFSLDRPTQTRTVVASNGTQLVCR